MRRTNNKQSIITALAAVAATLQSGCATAPRTAYQPYPPTPYSNNNPYNVSPAAGPVPAGAPPYAAPMAAAYPSADYEAGISAMKDRVERVEKAMLRLDRRMQLVERNELNRMSGASPVDQQSMAAPTQQLATRASNPAPDDEQTAMRQLNIGPPQQSAPAATFIAQVDDSSYQGDFRPVSTDTTIRAPLQAAPAKNLISLADTSPAAGRKPQAATDVAVWTIRYDTDDKVWPDRAQLPLSRDVVEALRAGSSVTLFARGPNPNGAQFRERVKALSRYLAKVTSQDNVPIAALPSPQMDTNTIEILATH